MKKLSRRDFLKLSGVTATTVAAAAVLAGCGDSGSTTPTQQQPAQQQPAQQQPEVNTEERSGEIEKEEGTVTGILPEMTYGCGNVFASLTCFRNNNAQHFQVIKRLYDRLVYLDGDSVYSNQAAKEIKVGEDGLTFDVEIYDNIVDSEGNHITADDVVWFVEQYMENGLKNYFKKVKSIEKTGDYSVRYVMKQDIAEVAGMVFASTFMVSKAAYEASADGFATYVVSTSPYKVTEFVPSNTIVMERRDDYWMPEELRGKYYTANIQKITETNISEVSQQQIALETGTIQAFPSVNTTIANAFVGNPDFFTCTSPSNNGNVIFFSGDEHSLCANNPDLRKALCYAIDPAGVIQGAMGNYGEPMHDICCRTCSGYVPEWDNNEYYPYSVDTAKEYLAKAGYNGEELNFVLVSTNTKLGTVLQAYWQQAGINVKMDPRDLALYNSVTPADYDIYMTQTGNGVANLYSQFLMKGYEYGNRIGYMNDELEEMLTFCCKTANYTPENLTKVRDYLYEQCYGFGIALPLVLNVVNNSVGMVTTAFNTQGYLDLVSCEYKA